MNAFYVGASHDPVEKRLEKHNNHHYGNHRYTAKADDWEIILVFETKDYAHAVRLERKIKSMKSKVYIDNLIKYPELRQKLFDMTST
jgi:putative endonuclease